MFAQKIEVKCINIAGILHVVTETVLCHTYYTTYIMHCLLITTAYILNLLYSS